MPLPKRSTKKQKSAARLRRYHARQAAVKYFGKDSVKGMTVHHKNGNDSDNRRKNLDLHLKSKHGKKHGRGVSSALPVKDKVRIKLKRFKKYL